MIILLSNKNVRNVSQYMVLQLLSRDKFYFILIDTFILH